MAAEASSPYSRSVAANDARRFILNRRAFIAGTTAAAYSFLLTPKPGYAASPQGLASAGTFLARARSFLAGLGPDQLRAVRFPWNGREWLGWNYFGGGSLIKPGLRLEQMTPQQQDAAWDVLAAVFSEAGIRKARNVMTLQDVLAAQGDSPALRSSKRFSFAFFGEPAQTGSWGFRLEGHHLTQSISVRDNRIVSVTPSSFSANPNRIGAGKHKGLVTLADETETARRLFADLDATQKRQSHQSQRALRNIMSWAGDERSNTKKSGIASASLKSAQRELLHRLIATYALDHLTPDFASTQRGRIMSGDPEAIHFAWYGPNQAETAFGYRIIGDSFVIELGSVDRAALHLHTIYHDLDNVLGRTA